MQNLAGRRGGQLDALLSEAEGEELVSVQWRNRGRGHNLLLPFAAAAASSAASTAQQSSPWMTTLPFLRGHTDVLELGTASRALPYTEVPVALW